MWDLLNVDLDVKVRCLLLYDVNLVAAKFLPVDVVDVGLLVVLVCLAVGVCDVCLCVCSCLPSCCS